jgi:hypothetical protein
MKATKLKSDAVLLRVNQRQGSVVICARSPDDPIPAADEWKLPDEPESVSVRS